MPKKLTLPERLNKIMKAMGWTTKAELARAAGCSRQAVGNWFNRMPESTIEFKYAHQLQSKTRFNAYWIVYGEGPERIDAISAEEAQLLDRYRNASKEKRRALSILLES